MAKRQGDISRRELLARGIAFGGVAMVGSSTQLFGQEPLSEGTVVPTAAKPLGDLRASLRGELLTSADPAYDEARKLWNGMFDKRPAAIARCTGTADVIKAVKFARSNDLAISVRGGGHNVAGKALRDGALAIDLSPMKGLRVDPKAKTADQDVIPDRVRPAEEPLGRDRTQHGHPRGAIDVELRNEAASLDDQVADPVRIGIAADDAHQLGDPAVAHRNRKEPDLGRDVFDAGERRGAIDVRRLELEHLDQRLERDGLMRRLEARHRFGRHGRQAKASAQALDPFRDVAHRSAASISLSYTPRSGAESAASSGTAQGEGAASERTAA